LAKVLVAEDELIYREYLAAAFDADGHEVRSCSDGLNAIRTGITFRPDVLVTDWMLKSSIHGLHVSRVLHNINPHQKTIVITGFPSSDLFLEPKTAEIFAVVQKPFELKELKEKVFEASSANHASPSQSDLGIIEIDDSHQIVFANAAAANMLRRVIPDDLNGDMDKYLIDSEDLFSQRNLSTWTSARTRQFGEELLIYPLTFSDKKGYLLLIISASNHLIMKSKLIELIINSYTGKPSGPVWPFDGRLILADANENFRRVTVDLFDAAGVLCHSADSPEHLLEILERDLGIRFLILDYNISEQLSFPETLKSFSDAVKAANPQIRVIGHSSEDHSQQFQDAGISLFLKKPWSIEQLRNLISENLTLN
jgi:DNA-binding NtrC family response regulator